MHSPRTGHMPRTHPLCSRHSTSACQPAHQCACPMEPTTTPDQGRPPVCLQLLSRAPSSRPRPALAWHAAACLLSTNCMPCWCPAPTQHHYLCTSPRADCALACVPPHTIACCLLHASRVPAAKLQQRQLPPSTTVCHLRSSCCRAAIIPILARGPPLCTTDQALIPQVNSYPLPPSYLLQSISFHTCSTTIGLARVEQIRTLHHAILIHVLKLSHCR